MMATDRKADVSMYHILRESC